MNKIEEILSELFNNENISLGVHGTGVLPKNGQEVARSICEEGLMCRYADIRRTVAFQDRGRINAHGNITFEQLIKYGYQKQDIGYMYETMTDPNLKLTRFENKQINLEQCSFIVAIPKEMKTTDKRVFCGERRMFSRPYAMDENELKIGTYKELNGRPIDPKYIVGYFMNHDISTFEFNSNFYGFKKGKDNRIPELDLEEIKRVNEEVRQANEMANKSTQDLGRETIDQQRQTQKKKGIFNLLKNLLNKSNEKNTNRMRDD